MNKTCILLLFVLYTNVCFGLDFQSDSVEIFINPDKIVGSDFDGVVYCTIVNYNSDTLVTTSDIYIEGLPKSLILFYPISGYYHPNLLFFSPKDFVWGFGDGIFKINFNQIPKLLVIPPKSQRVMKILINHYENFYSFCRWKISSLFTFCEIKFVNSLIYYRYPQQIEEYKNALVIKDTVCVIGHSKDTLFNDTKMKDSIGINTFNLIQDLFK